MVEDKDVITVIIPSALTLSALLLVVIGMALREASDAVRDWSSRPPSETERRWIGVSSFAMGFAMSAVASGFAASALGVVWMLRAADWSYALAVGLFFSAVSSAALYSFVFVTRVVRRLSRLIPPDPDA